jgi:hypothetical protein
LLTKGAGAADHCSRRAFESLEMPGIGSSPMKADAKRIVALRKTTYTDQSQVNYELFEKYESAIRGYQGPQGDPQSPSLRMHRNGGLVVYYAPFEWVNPAAKVVLVDTTPWKAQADIAFAEANRALLEGAPASEVLRRANLAAAFAGVTRQRVVALLDHIGVHGG